MKSDRPARCWLSSSSNSSTTFGDGDDAELRRVELARLAQDLAQDVVGRRCARVFTVPAALAGRARLAQHVGQRLARALARHLDQPELREAARP